MIPVVIFARNRSVFKASFPYPKLQEGAGRYLYVIGPPDESWVKVGFAMNIHERTRDFLHESGSEQIALFYATEVQLYAATEQCAHNILKPYRSFSERFDVTPNAAVDAVELAISIVASNPSANYTRADWNRTGKSFGQSKKLYPTIISV